MNDYAKKFFRLLFNVGVIILIAVLLWYVLLWVAGGFFVPAMVMNVIGSLIFIYAAYRVIMLIWAFLEQNPPKI